MHTSSTGSTWRSGAVGSRRLRPRVVAGDRAGQHQSTLAGATNDVGVWGWPASSSKTCRATGAARLGAEAGLLEDGGHGVAGAADRAVGGEQRGVGLAVDLGGAGLADDGEGVWSKPENGARRGAASGDLGEAVDDRGRGCLGQRHGGAHDRVDHPHDVGGVGVRAGRRVPLGIRTRAATWGW